MATKGSRMSAATRRRVERSAGALSTGAIKRMEANLDWYRALSAEDRSWVGLVAQAGIAAFIAWCRDPSAQPHITADVFGTAPRELAFAAAQVYAEAAEARGAWDARLESLVVDAVLRGEADDSMQSRAAALGWGSVSHVAVVAGATPSGDTAGVVDALRRGAARLQVESLAAVQGRRLVGILGGVEDAGSTAQSLAEHFG